MTKTSDYNSDLYYLGRICKYGHGFADTQQSLRQCSNRTCIECQKKIKLKYVSLNAELCAERMRRWRKNIASRENVTMPSQKNCSVCNEQKTSADFYPEKYSFDGLHSHCKDCDKVRQNNYRVKRRKPRVYKDPELIKENRRKIKNRYKKTPKGKLANTISHHRRKAVLLMTESENYTPTQLQLRFAEFDNKCVYCDSSDKISIDHFNPVSKLGADKLGNIVPACVKCNSSKNNKLPEVWFRAQSFFTVEKWKNLIRKLEI